VYTYVHEIRAIVERRVYPKLKISILLYERTGQTDGQSALDSICQHSQNNDYSRELQFGHVIKRYIEIKTATDIARKRTTETFIYTRGRIPRKEPGIRKETYTRKLNT